MARTCRDVMHSVTLELVSAGEMAEALQAQLSGVSGIAAICTEVQALDRLTQTLFALSGFLGALLPGLDADGAMDLQLPLASVTLGPLAARLGATEATFTDTDGELDLFEVEDAPAASQAA